MKLRLRENSLRLRLLQTEVKNLSEHGFVAEKITFAPGQTFVYRLEISDRAGAVSADFGNGRIKIKIPRTTAENWIETDLVGLRSEQETSGEKPLSILIEKDFVCVDRPADADSLDAFPHPKMKC